jgi:hypothetical protein
MGEIRLMIRLMGVNMKNSPFAISDVICWSSSFVPGRNGHGARETREQARCLPRGPRLM